tara:strand:+ start:285 stop:410 length:126 start_codon:yes stop_codon:yes gene_type:complete
LTASGFFDYIILRLKVKTQIFGSVGMEGAYRAMGNGVVDEK